MTGELGGGVAGLVGGFLYTFGLGEIRFVCS